VVDLRASFEVVVVEEMPWEANGSESDRVKRDCRNDKGFRGASEGVRSSTDDRRVEETEWDGGLFLYSVVGCRI